jgi:hypothetical protein
MAFKRVAVVLSLGCALFVLSQPISAGAAKKKPTKTDPALPTVEKVLRAEVTGEVDRRGQLAETLKQHPDSPLARWQAGFIKNGNSWQPFDTPTAATSESQLLKDYHVRREDAPRTFAGQLDLANWCRKEGMKDQERAHLLVALSLADEADRPNLLERLGYLLIGNEWLSHEDLVAWQQLNRRIEGAVKNLGPRLEKIAERIDGTRRQHDLAVATLVKLTDPDAIPAIQYVLAGRNEACAEAAIDAFGKSESLEATVALAQAALFSKWPEVRQRAIAPLKTRRFDDFVPDIIRLLASHVSGTTVVQFLIFRDRTHRPGTTGSGVQFVLLVNCILARETDDQFQVATFQSADLRVNALLQGQTVSFYRFPQSIDRAEAAAIHINAPESLRRERILEEMNERTDEVNRRVVSVLAELSGRAPDPEPTAWWKWWADYSDLQQSGSKPVTVVSEYSEVQGDPSLRVRVVSCFASGTPVWTESGPQAIEAIKVGDRVLAKDIETGELAYKPVLQTTVRPPKELTTLRFGDETIVCTGGHRFWSSGSGWIKVRDLEPQTLLHTVTGNTPVWSAKKGSSAETYNLVVADFHTYFVGKTGVLCQDVLIPHATNSVVPGLARK